MSGQAGSQIEITPEMEEAGLGALHDHAAYELETNDGARFIVRDIIRAALEVASRSRI